MFSFLNIGILIGLVGVIIPFLIHLFAKKKQKKVYFSTLRFLKILQPRELRRIRIKQILLMIIRGLIILFLVLGFSRPVCRQSSGFQSKAAASALALVIDRSLSLKRSGMLEELKADLYAVLDLMNSEDRASFFLTQGNRQQASHSWNNQVYLKGMVDNIDISFHKGNLLPKVLQSLQFLSKQKELNKELYIFTDLQASEWDSEKDSTWVNNWEGNIFIIPIPGESKNIAVSQTSIKSSMDRSGAAINVFSEIGNFSDNVIEELLIRISLNDKTVDQMTVDLRKDEKKRIEFKSVKVDAGWNYGTISVQDGSFPYDDISYFVYHQTSQRNIILAGSEEKDILPVKLCLEAQDKNTNNYTVSQFVAGDDWKEQLDSSQVIIFSNYPQFKASEIESIKEFLYQGGGIIFIMGDNINIKELNQQFFQPVAEMTLGDVNKSREHSLSNFFIRKVDYGHPLFQGIFERGKTQFKSPRIYQSIEFLGDNFIPIMELNNSYPFMIEKEIGRGKIFCLATSLQASWSDFEFSTIFAPLMIQSIEYLSRKQMAQLENKMIGDRISLDIQPQTIKGKFYIQDPENRSIVVAPEIKNDKISLVLESAPLPGIYRFSQNSTLLGLRAVNVDTRESDFTQISEQKIEDFFPLAKVQVINDIHALEQVVSRSRFGRELWKVMIALALGLILVEMILAKGKKDKNLKVDER